jgi:hypothetical protein
MTHNDPDAHKHISGYDPETGICWQFCNKGDTAKPRCKCPAHSNPYGERTLTWFGRCRSGSRWFWSAATFNREKEAEGWADTEEEAMDAAMAAVCSFRDGLPILVKLSHGHAYDRLKELNEAKRAARPSSNAKDSKVVEYLYDGSYNARYPITKRTSKRVYYSRRAGESIDSHGEPLGDSNRFYWESYVNTGYVDREKLERDGRVGYLFASQQAYLRDNRHRFSKTDLRTLKAEMTAAHPDKGGSHEAFIAARKAYETELKRVKMLDT